MKKIILPRTVLEFPKMVIDGLMEKNCLQEPPRKEIRSSRNKEGPPKI